MKKQKSGRVRSGNPAKWLKRAAPTAPSSTGLARLPGASARQLGKLHAASFERAERRQHAHGTRQPGVRTASRITLAAPAWRDDRQALMILLAPFLIVAFSLASQPTSRTVQLRMPEIAAPSAMSREPGPANNPGPALATARPAIIPRIPPRLSVAVAPEAHPEIVAETPARLATGRSLSQTSLPKLPDIAVPPLPSFAPVAKPTEPRLASLERPLPSLPAVALPPLSLAPLAPKTCSAAPALLAGRAKVVSPVAIEPGGFGRALAAAARAQLDDLVIYNARYARLSYPMGDVATFYGVCTDVVVRAYRALGIDLQELIHTTKSGRGDINIDHRRVDVVRRFFEKHGAAVAVSDYAEDYQPGDIVTYYRPQNRTSTAHIAIVSDKPAPSGRLMIIHNRGWGPQLEDGLFVDKITGHYRFAGLRGIEPSVPMVTAQAAPSQIRTAVPAVWQLAVMSRAPDATTVAAPSSQSWRGLRAMCLPQPAMDTRENVTEHAAFDLAPPAFRPARRQKLAKAVAATAVLLDR